MKIILRLVVLVLENAYAFVWFAIEFVVYVLFVEPYFPQMIDAPPEIFENQLGLSSDCPYSEPNNPVDCLRQRELSGLECTSLHPHATEECLVPAVEIRSETRARARALDKDLNNAVHCAVGLAGEIDGSSPVSFEAGSHPLKDASSRHGLASPCGNPDDIVDQRGSQPQGSRNKLTGTMQIESYPKTSPVKPVISSQHIPGSPGMIRRSRSASVSSLRSVPESLVEDDIATTHYSSGSATNHVSHHPLRHATNIRNPRFGDSAAASPGSSSNKLRAVSRDRSITGLSVSSSGAELRRYSATASNPELRPGASYANQRQLGEESLKDSSPGRRTANYPPTKIPEKIDRTWNPRQYIYTSQIRRVSSLQTISEPCYSRAVSWVSTSSTLIRKPTEEEVYHNACSRENEPYRGSLPQSSDENNNEARSRLAPAKAVQSLKSNSAVTTVDDVAESKLINVPKAHQSFPARFRASFSRGKMKEQNSKPKPSKHSSSVVGEPRHSKPRDGDFLARVTGLGGNKEVKSVNKGAPGLQNCCRTTSECAQDLQSETASNVKIQKTTHMKHSVKTHGRCPGKSFIRSDTGQLGSESHVNRYSQDCDDNSNLRTVKSRGFMRKVVDKFMPRRTEKTAKQEKSKVMKSQGKSVKTMERIYTKIGHSNSSPTSTDLVETECLVRTHPTTEVFATLQPHASDSLFRSMPAMTIPADEYFIALIPPSSASDRCNHVHNLPFGGSNLELTMMEPVATGGRPHQQLHGEYRSMSDIRKSRSSQSMFGAQDPHLRRACSTCTSGDDNWPQASSDYAITPETDPLYNTLLKASIRLLHEDVVKAITPPSEVIDHLYANYMLTTGQVEELTQTPNLTPSDRSRRLLAMLQESGNQRCFVQLRMALVKDMATHWLVELVDKKCEDIVLRGVNASSSW